MRLNFEPDLNWKLGLALYFSIIYLPGCIFWLTFPNVFENYYSQGGLPAWFTIPIIFMCILLVCFLCNLKLWNLRVKKINVSFFLFCFLLLSISLLFMLLSIKLAGQVSHSFRHQGRLSDYGGAGYVYYFFKTLCELFFLRLILTKDFFKVTGLNRLCLFLSSLFFIAGSIFLSIGSFQFISIIFALLVMFKSFNVNINYFLSKINISSIIPLLLTALGTILFGVGVKVGFDAYLDPDGRDVILTYLSKVLARLSTSLYSAHYALGDSLARPMELIDASLKIAGQRFETLFFGKGSDDLLMNINSYNYLSAFASQGGERGGASPGPIGTIFYLIPLPLGFFIVISLLLIVRKSLTDKMPAQKSWIHVFIVIYILTRVLESPLLYLQLLDLSFIFFILFTTIFLFLRIGSIDNETMR